MKREFLEKLGLEKEVIDKIADEHGKTVEGLKSKLNVAEDTNKQLKSDIDSRDKDIKELRKNVGDSDEWKDKFETLDKKTKEDKKASDEKIQGIQKDAAIKIAVAGKVHDPDLIINLIDKDKIELDESGKVKLGLDEQVKNLETEKAFLFVKEQKPGSPGQIDPSGDDDPDEDGINYGDINAAFGITEDE